MKQLALATALSLALVASASAQVIISEVIDGDLAGGNPKVVELTNLECAPYTFADGCALKIYFNGSLSPNTTVDLAGVTIPARSSITIASTSNSGDVAYQTAYSDDADIYTGSNFSNGDDTVTIECNDIVQDIYGVLGVDGTGEAWEFTNSFAYSLPGRVPSDVFNPADWTFGGVDALDAGTDPERITLLQDLTTPKAHDHGLGPCVAVPSLGAVGTVSLTSLLLIAGTIVLRRN